MTNIWGVLFNDPRILGDVTVKFTIIFSLPLCDRSVFKWSSVERNLMSFLIDSCCYISEFESPLLWWLVMKSVTWQTLKWDCWKYVMSAFVVTAGYRTHPTGAILQLTRDFKGQQGCHFKENSAISGLLKEVKWLYPAIAAISVFRLLLLLILERCMKRALS